MSVDLAELRERINRVTEDTKRYAAEVEAYKAELEEQREEDRLERSLPALDARPIRKRLDDAIAELTTTHKEAARVHPVLRVAAYTPDERRQLQEHADQAFLEAWQAIEEDLAAAVRAEETRVDNAVAALEDPLRQLSSSESVRASSMLAFVSEAAERSSPRDVYRQVRSVIASGDRAACATWWHVLASKGGAFIGQLRQASDAGDDGGKEYDPLAELCRAAANDDHRRRLKLAEDRVVRIKKTRGELVELANSHLFELDIRGGQASGKYGQL